MKTKATVKPSKIKKVAPKDTEDTKSYLLVLPESQFEALLSLKKTHRSTLNVNVSVAFLIRQAIGEYIPKAQEKLLKASKGRFHAKIRK